MALWINHLVNIHDPTNTNKTNITVDTLTNVMMEEMGVHFDIKRGAPMLHIYQTRIAHGPLS